MKLALDEDTRVTEDAARWFGVLLHGNSKRAEFFEWLEESPRHVEEFLFVMADAQDLALLTPSQRARVEELGVELAAMDSSASNVLPLGRHALRADSTDEPPRGARLARRHLLRVSAVAAAVLLVASSVIWWVTGPGAWKTYRTGVGEQRAIELADGSRVDLNTDSAVAVRLTDTSRNVRLTRGEALFSVSHDPGRPFLVQTSSAVIQAIGTKFNVYRRDDRTRVAVLEGLVQVSDVTTRGPAPVQAQAPSHSGSVHLLTAGEAADVSLGGTVSQPRVVDTGKTVAWRQRRLVFEEDTLGEIAAEFNRYNAAVKIRVEGEAATEHFSGTFDADAPEAMMAALAGDPTLSVEKEGSEIVIGRRRPKAP